MLVVLSRAVAAQEAEQEGPRVETAALPAAYRSKADAYQAYQALTASSYSGAQQPYASLPQQRYGGYAAHTSQGYRAAHEPYTHQPLRGYQGAYGQDKYGRQHPAGAAYESSGHQYPSAAPYDSYYSSSNPYARAEAQQQQQQLLLNSYAYQQAPAYRPSSSYLGDAAVEYSVSGLDRAQPLQQQQQQQSLLTAAPQMYRVTAEGAYPLPAAAAPLPVAAAHPARQQRQPTRVHFDDAYQALQQQVFNSAWPGSLLGAGAGYRSHAGAYSSGGYRQATAYTPATSYSKGVVPNSQSEQWWKDHNAQDASAAGQQPSKASALDRLDALLTLIDRVAP